MKKIQKNPEAEKIFKEFLQENDIINKAKNLFNNIDKSKFSNIIKSLKKDKINIEDLFLGSPKKLRKIVNIINQYRSEINVIYDKVKPYLKVKNAESKISKDLIPYYEIIKFFEKSYNIFSKKQKNYAYQFTKALDIIACPYCNLEYIETVTRNSKKIYRPDIDHFYPRNLYPFLSVAFHNLIPSCNKCNERIKKQQDTKDFLTPYECDFHKIAKFTIIFKKNEEISLNKIKQENQFELKLVDKQACAKNNDIQRAILEIEPRYNERKKVITDIIIQYRKLTKMQLKESKSTCRTNYTFEKMLEIILGENIKPKYINSKPLTKLKIDLKEMLINNYNI